MSGQSTPSYASTFPLLPLRGAVVFPGATVPFGAVQLSPDTYNDGWDWCAGYHRSDSSIMGFTHTHLSGTGCGDTKLRADAPIRRGPRALT